MSDPAPVQPSADSVADSTAQPLPVHPVAGPRIGHLSKPPSARFVDAVPGGGAVATTGGRLPIPRGTVAAALLVAWLGAVLLTVILGVLATTAGTFLVSGAAGVAIGLLIASAAIPGPVTVGARPAAETRRAPGARPAAALTRAGATRLAMGIAGSMIVLAGIGVWLVAISEGGVLDPISYLWTTFGFGIPAEALVAVVAAAWGAANGPIRWRR